MELTKTLSKREYQVADLLAKGFIIKEIAEELCISPDTVNNHSANIRKKINARGLGDVVRIYILNLENPKRYFSALSLLVVHFFIVCNSYSVDIRRLPRTQRVTKTFRVAKKLDT